MGIFGNRKSEEMPSLFAPRELDEPIEYQEVMEYLVGLSDKDFKTTCEVAVVYRTAEIECAKILGIKVQPSTFINPPEPPESITETPFLDDDDELATAFLDDEPTPGPKKKSARKPKQ